MQLRATTLALSAGGLFACGVAAGWLAPTLMNTATAAAMETTRAPSTPPAPVALGSAPDWAAIVTENRAAVVSITSRSVEQEQQPDMNGMFGNNSPFDGDPFFKFFQEIPTPRNVPVQSLGSGFLVRSDGIILTNAHVVRNATHVTVKLSDNREYRAKVIGLDTATDVAVLKIDAHNLPTVRIGDSGKLRVGNYVLALGAPYGLEESATAGIVSAIGRSLGDNSYVPFIQTDVAVNPGNSGGPLFNEHGGVVGINSQIYSNTGGFEGISFAIPISVVMHDEQEILKNGKVEHARLGVLVQPVNQALAGSFGLNAPQGALVSKVEPDSAASRAGLRAGDVILRLDGNAVRDNASLAAQIGMLDPGSHATLEVWRNGKPLTIDVTLGNAANPTELASTSEGSGHAKLGLAVRPLTPEERAQAGVPEGLLVESSSGPAADAGIEPGDIVLSADGKPLDSVQQLQRIVRDSEKKNAIALLIQHGDERIFVPVQLG